MEIDNLRKKYIDFCFNKLIPFIMLAIPLVIVHEIIHYSIIKLQGYNVVFNYNLLLPIVSYASIEGITKFQLFLTAISPYILDVFLLTIFYFYRKNKTIRILSWAPFLDLVWNFFMLFTGIIFNKPNDFIIMFVTGNGVFAVALVIVADLLWWRIVRE